MDFVVVVVIHYIRVYIFNVKVETIVIYQTDHRRYPPIYNMREILFVLESRLLYNPSGFSIYG